MYCPPSGITLTSRGSRTEETGEAQATMVHFDDRARIDSPLAAAAEVGADPPQQPMREIVHDLNGALNSLTLHIELLDAATSNARGAAHDPAGRARHFDSLRRAVRQIQAIVEHRLLTLGRDAAPPPPLEE